MLSWNPYMGCRDILSILHGMGFLEYPSFKKTAGPYGA